MANAQPLNATFFAFRKREKGGVLLGASVTFAVLLILLFVAWALVVGLAMGGGAMMLDPKAAADPNNAAAFSNPSSIFTLLIGELVLVFLICVLIASYEAACLRWMIRGEKGGLFGLSLNADTWRVYSGYWMWFLFFIVAYFVLAILIIAFGALSALMMNGDQPMAVRVALGLAAFVVCFSLPIYLGVRTAPAAATSVGTRRFAFFDSWRVSKGRFWALFGSFFLLWIIYLIFVIALWGFIFGSTLWPALQQIIANPGDPAGNSARINEAMLATFGNPKALAIYYSAQLVGLVVALLFYVLNYGVNARAVIAAAEDGKIDGVSTATVANTFT